MRERRQSSGAIFGSFTILSSTRFSVGGTAARIATAIEYGLIAAGISVAIISVVNSLGSKLVNTFTNVSSQLGNAGH